MDRNYKYNPDTTYKPNQGRYLQLITVKDLYIQNITVSEHDSFKVKFPNVFTNYPLGAVRVYLLLPYIYIYIYIYTLEKN